jgi:hypothetical protein
VTENVRMKKKIDDILEETGYRESRAAKMDLNDILKYVCSHPLVGWLISAL